VPILIAIVTCDKYKTRADSQRETWVPLTKGADVRFFLGSPARPPLADEVFLDVPDDYDSLPLKVRAMCRWAIANGYDRVFKLDDDCYVYSDLLIKQMPSCEYAGHVNRTKPEWCSGFGYWLGPLALQLVAQAGLTLEVSEDRWVADVLRGHEIVPENIPGIQVADCIPPWNCIGPDTIVACEFDEKEMLIAHNLPGGWRARKARIDASRARIMRGDGKPFYG
jgi:hypothetical protein